MARQKSEFLSSAGRVFQLVKAVVDPILARGGNDEDVRRILSDLRIREKFADIVMAAGTIQSTYEVVVDYNQTLAQMIEAGHYDWVYRDITQECFPIEGEGRQEVEVRLFHFNQKMNSGKVLAELRKAGYRPATLPELLALGAAQPDLQEQFPIVALGSVWPDPYGNRSVTSLSRRGSGRDLDLSWFGYAWGGICRFLAVRDA